MDYNAPDLIDAPKAELMKNFMVSILTWETYIDSSMRYAMHIFPLFAVIPTIPFLYEKKSYFVLGAGRFQNVERSITKAILYYTLQGGMCISLTFVVFFTIGNIFMIPQLSYIGGFSSIFPENFYQEHAYWFFIFMAVTMYFLFGCIFAGMSCAIALFTDKEFYMVVIPLMFYIAESYVGYGLNIRMFQISSCVGVFNTSYSTAECFVPLFPLILLNGSLIFAGLKRRRKGVIC